MTPYYVQYIVEVTLVKYLFVLFSKNLKMLLVTGMEMYTTSLKFGNFCNAYLQFKWSCYAVLKMISLFLGL